MKKTRVIQYCNQFSLGGTERTIELFCKHLNPDHYEIFAVCKEFRPDFLSWFRVKFGLLIRHKLAIAKNVMWKHMNARVPNFIFILGAEKVFVVKDDFDLENLILKLAPDILHIHYSGRAEAPITSKKVMTSVPMVVTTNQFEIENTSQYHKYVKKMMFVSNWMLTNQAKWAAHDPRSIVFYNPCEKPLTSENLRTRLNIPSEAFVFGRVGRADPGIHDPISIQAYQLIQNDRTYFLALSAPTNMIEEARGLGLKNFISLPAIRDEVEMSRFYNTIDVLAHARVDGETFGCNLAEAMIHGKPCISHFTDAMNAQEETIDGGGKVVGKGDVEAYAAEMAKLMRDKVYYNEISARARERALSAYEATTLTKRLDSIYTELLPRKPKSET